MNVFRNQLKAEKDKVITLELTVSKEQGTLKKMNSLLEEERNKARESQKEDIALIEVREFLITFVIYDYNLKINYFQNMINFQVLNSTEKYKNTVAVLALVIEINNSSLIFFFTECMIFL